jgi:hypothetical protein
MDWRQPAFKPHSFSFIWGADIVYESRFFLPLVKLFSRALAPGGQIWLSSPNRDVAGAFWDLLQASGFSFQHVKQENVAYQGQVNMQIHIWKVTRTETAPSWQ